MKLRRVRLEDYRGIDVSEVEFLESGVTIVQGPNEAGKSCIAEAIDIVLEFADSSSDRRVKALKPTHRDAGPAIEIDMEVGAYAFTYRKRYLKNKETLLTITSPKNESLTGREAHDVVRQILAENVDEALWRALRVQQGIKIDQASMAEAVSLGAALDRAAGAAPVGDAEVAVVDLARAEYKRYFTDSGREGRALSDARFALEEARAEVDKWAAELDAIDADVVRAARLRAEVAGLRARRAEADETVVVKERRWRAVCELASEVERLRLEWENAAAAAGAARERCALRRELIEAVAQAGRERDRLRSDLTAAAPSLEASRAEYERLEREQITASSALTETRSLLQVRERDFELRRDELDLELLRERRGKIEAAQAALSDANEALADAAIDAAMLERIRAQHLAAERARAALQAGSPSVRVTARSEVSLTIDGADVAVAPGDEVVRSVGDRATLEVPNVIEVQVEAGRSLDALSAARTRAVAALEASLQEARVADVGAAEQAYQRREEAQRTVAQARAAIQEALRDLDVEGMGARIAGLEQRIARYRKQRAAEPPLPGTLDDARRMRDELASQMRTVSEADEHAVAALTAAKKALDAIEAGQRDLQIRLAAAERGVEQAAARLATARADALDEALEAAARAAEERERAARETHDARASNLEAEDPDTVRELAELAEQARDGLARQLASSTDELRDVEALLRVRGEEGLYDKLQAARTRQRAASEEFERLTRRADAARLLFETLVAHRDAATRAYVGPLRDQIVALGKIVFGASFSVELGEDLRIVSRTLQGRTVPFESLSVGTREQLSLIARLAGSMLVARDGGVPVIFDDALGYSDEQRLEGMGAVLSLAGRVAQVIVLTCVPARYSHVGGARIVRLSDCGSDPVRMPRSA